MKRTFLGVLICFTIVSQAKAYRLSGLRLETLQPSVIFNSQSFLQSTNPSQTAISFKGSALKAYQTWSSAASALRFQDGGETSITGINNSGQSFILFKGGPSPKFCSYSESSCIITFVGNPPAYVSPIILQCVAHFNQKENSQPALRFSVQPSFDNAYDFESYALRALGQCAGLEYHNGLSNGQPTVMYAPFFDYYVDRFYGEGLVRGQTRRQLTSDDIAGIRAIYGRIEILQNTVFEDDDGADDDVWYSRSATITTPTSLDIIFEWSNNDNGCNNTGPDNCNFVQLFSPRVLNLASGDVITFSLRLDEDDFSADCVYLKVLVNGNLAFPEQSAEPWDVGAIKIWAAVR